MPESGTYGSVRGAPSNGRPHRDHFWDEVGDYSTAQVQLAAAL